MPATCHSLTSRYSLIASAAKNERLRPVLLANLSSRLLSAEPTRTVKVVDLMIYSVVIVCIQLSTNHLLVQDGHVHTTGCSTATGSMKKNAGDFQRKSEPPLPRRTAAMRLGGE